MSFSVSMRQIQRVRKLSFVLFVACTASISDSSSFPFMCLWLRLQLGAS
jgi:hypothetical protein